MAAWPGNRTLLPLRTRMTGNSRSECLRRRGGDRKEAITVQRGVRSRGMQLLDAGEEEVWDPRQDESNPRLWKEPRATEEKLPIAPHPAACSPLMAIGVSLGSFHCLLPSKLLTYLTFSCFAL
ncbi:hypothetical protein Baya_4680 [Bagarius yarrelli]|uniref:Uncharacterized protein n=1 Tax=Bagarius yarrelli TaxID=175774 RepID=A0A556TT74_BAGYA|nr:hypothetical protein Baya_4680 [Bagarius yarrelli]